MNSARKISISPLAVWIVVCAVLNAAGWLLSAMGQLNPAGYSTVVISAVGVTGWWWYQTRPNFRTGFRARRFRRSFPMAFAVVAVLALAGGVLHAPANFDALAYRTPRVLHWLADGQWHWIHTDFHRLNTRGNGIEWITAPLVIFTGTDRFFFLINAVSFLLLPGICYRLLVGLRVRKRVAWHWMWLLPSGYCYILQAGSIANDLFGAMLALAAMDYALRAARDQSAGLASMAILAAALMTSSKAFNILLLLPWGLAMLPTMGTMLKRPLLSVSVGVAALLVSIVPTSLLNHHYCGDWKGLKAEPVQLSAGTPGFHLAINSILLSLHHLNPPINPLAGSWNHWTANTLPETWKEKIAKSFEPSAVTFNLGEMQMEEVTGLGFGVSLLILAILIGKHRLGPIPPVRELPARAIRAENLVPLGASFSTLYFLSQSGLGCPARYLAPFYVLLLVPILRLPRADDLLRRAWWRRLAFVSFSLAALLLILTPPRPLWPAQTLLKAFHAHDSGSAILRRIWTVYSVYGDRSDGFKPVRDLLPADLKILGLVTFDDPETSLWRPFGSRRSVHVTRSDDAVTVRARGIRHILVSEYTLQSQGRFTLEQWLDRYDAEITTSLDLPLRASRGSTRWHLVRLRSQSSSPEN